MFRSRTFVVGTLIFCLLVCCTGVFGQSQRVALDPAVAQALQDLQTAYERKDTAAYNRLIADSVNKIDWNTQEYTTKKLSRSEFITQFLGESEEARFQNPFGDKMPVSQRALYAQNVSGGQKVRILCLSRNIPGFEKQPINWVMDLTLLRQGGGTALSEINIAPSDFIDQVAKPFLKDLEEWAQRANKDELRNMKEEEAFRLVVDVYRKHWAAFAATMPQTPALVARTKDSTVVVVPPDTKTTPVPPPQPPRPPQGTPPAQVYKPPPPPPINFPVQPTRMDTLPNPPPAFLPPQQITPRVRELRSQIQAIIQRDFAAFLQSWILEQYVQYEGRRLYVNVYQNRYRATYTTFTLVITVRIVFVQPPRGPMMTYTVPIIEDENPAPPPPVQPLPQEPMALQPPAARATGCMVLTDTAKLKAKHGQARFDQIQRFLAAYGQTIDLAGQNTRDTAAIDRLVEQRFDRANCDCLFIFGNHDVVPMVSMDNPSRGKPGDNDAEIFSDDPYADFDRDRHLTPEVMIVRLPDDPDIMADTNSVMYRPSASSGRILLSDYAQYANRHRSSPPLLDKIANPSRRDLLVRSGPLTGETFPRTFFQGHNVLINLHGSDGWKDSAAYQGELQEPGQEPRFAIAMTADHAVAPDAVVISSACFGASIWTNSNGTIVPKTPNNHVGLRYLRNGAAAFIGSTRVAWQATDPREDGNWAQIEPQSARRFIELTREGNSPQKAFQLMKREMARLADLSPYNKKMQHQMVYLGLPPSGGRTVQPVPTPDRPATMRTQLARVAEQLRDAAQEQNIDRMVNFMTPTVRDGIEDGVDTQARDRAQQIVELMRRPDAANPLADKDAIEQRLFLVEKVGENEYAAHFRTPFKTNVLGLPHGAKATVDSVTRLRFRQEGEQFKLSAWEDRNQQFVDEVAKPLVEWVHKNEVRDEAQAIEKYEDLVEAFIENSVSKAVRNNAEATQAPNPLAPRLAPGSSTLLIVSLAGGGLLLVTVAGVALRRRNPPPGAQPRAGGRGPGNGGLSFTCPQCGKHHSVGAEFAGRTARCACGTTVQVPGGAEGGDLQILPSQGPAAQPVYRPAVQVVPVPVAGVPVMVLPGPADPEWALRAEQSGRRMALIFIALMLLASLLIPTVVSGGGGMTASWPELALLNVPGVSVMDKLLAVFPGIAAIVIFVLAMIGDGRWRGALLTALPWAPVIILAVRKDMLPWAALGPHIGLLAGSRHWPLMIGVGSILLLWVASRARWYRPSYGALYWPGLAGAAAFIAWQVWPVGPVGAKQLPLADLIAVLNGAGPTEQKVRAIAELVALGLVAIAALLALCNPPGQRTTIRAQAGGTFSLVLLGGLVLAGLLVVPDFIQTVQQPAESAVPDAISQIKMVLHELGILLLVLSGPVDLIVGPARRPQAQGILQ